MWCHIDSSVEHEGALVPIMASFMAHRRLPQGEDEDVKAVHGVQASGGPYTARLQALMTGDADSRTRVVWNAGVQCGDDLYLQ